MKDNSTKIFVSIIGVILICKVLMDLQQIFVPLVIAYSLYFMFEPLNNYLIKKKIPSSLLVFLNISIIFSSLFFTSQLIYNQFENLSQNLPQMEAKLNVLVSSTARSMGITNTAFINFNLSELLQKVDYTIIAENAFTTTLDIFSSFILVLLFFGFISSGHSRLFELIKRRYIDNHSMNLTGEEEKDTTELENIKKLRAGKIEETFRNIIEQVQKYILTKTIISVFTGIVVGIILFFFGVDYTLVWVALTILLNFIPTIGSILAVIFPTIIALIQFNSFSHAFLIAALLAGVQNIIGNILEPKIMGDKLGLNPLVILISLLIWGYIWGIPGMFLSVPLTAIIKIILVNSESQSLNFLGNLMGQ